jgi:hypothetical protein
MFLEMFFQQAKDDRDFLPYRETATVLLQDQQSKYPQLQKFFKPTKDTRDFLPYKEKDSAILHYQLPKYPQLLVPPEPTDLKLL